MSRLNLRQRPRISYCELEEPTFDEYIFCEQCADFVYEYCSIHGPLLVVPDDKVPDNPTVPSFVPRAALTVPNVFLHLAPSVIPGAGLGVFTSLTLPRDVRFGPYKGQKTRGINSMYCWQIYDSNNKPSHAIDGADPDNSNWMRYVNCARHSHEQNLVAFQYQGQLYYRTIKIIPRFTELLVFYGSEFANSLQLDLRKYNAPSEYQRILGARILKQPKLDSSKGHIDDKNKECIKPNKNIPDIPIVQIIDRNGSQAKVNNQNYNLQDSRKEQFICNECYKEFNTKDSIIIHLKTKHTIDLYFRCNKCAYFTLTKETLDKHSELHDETRRYACKICNYRFKNSAHLRKHERICYQKSDVAETRIEKLYPCSECGKPFNNKSDLVRHKIIHTGEKPYACPECGKLFRFQYYLVRHKITHSEKKPYPCSVCAKLFKSRRDLVRHKIRHTGEKRYSCSECGNQFTDKNYLVRHIRIHTGEKPYACQECGKRFRFQTDLARHKITHTGKTPHPCTNCGKRFRTQRDLVRHKIIHTGEKPYSCSECGKQFSDKSSLVRHIRIHTGEKPHACAECKKRFIEKSKLKQHMRIHTGTKPYICIECQKRFNRKQLLTRHMTIHTGIKPYSCSKCHQIFSQRSHMNRHVKTVHKVDNADESKIFD